MRSDAIEGKDYDINPPFKFSGQERLYITTGIFQRDRQITFDISIN